LFFVVIVTTNIRHYFTLPKLFSVFFTFFLIILHPNTQHTDIEIHTGQG